MKVEALKEKARRHEQKEEWQKALDLYQEAIRKHDEDEPPDITLYNRVGDIQIRVGQVDGAVASYEKAIELYLEAELHNNAIAVCKKVLRNLPDRAVFFLRMGQIRGQQGFLTDARQNFLTYAEMVTEAGDMDSAMDALVEFVSLSPEDLEIRMGLAAQLESHGRTAEAVEQYADAFRRFTLQDRMEEAETVRAKVAELSPDTMLPDAQSLMAGAGAQVADQAPAVDQGLAAMELGGGESEAAAADLSAEPAEEVEAEFGEIVIGGAEEEAAAEEEEAVVATSGEEDLGGFEIGAPGDADEMEEEAEEEEEAEPLPTLPDFGPRDEDEEMVPTFGLGKDGEVEEEAEPLPTFGFEEEEVEEEAEPLPTFGFEEEEAEEAAEPLPTFDAAPEEEAEEAAEPLPTFDAAPDEEKLEAAAVEARESEGELKPEDFGEADHGDRETKEYVEAEEPLSELDVALDEIGAETPEAREEAAAAPSQALEEAMEEAAAPPSQALEEAATAPAQAREEALEETAPSEAPTPPAPRAPSSHEEAAEAGDLDLAMELLRAQIAARPDHVELRQRMVEYAFRTADQPTLINAYLELAVVLTRTQATTKAKAIYQQVLSLAPGHPAAQEGLAALEGEPVGKAPTQVASSEEYVDLGSMILGDGEEKTTRWQVTADSPSGDEQADFAKMLSQFKEKVSEHVDAGDVSAHHDLGTAYMEMGLLEEAISEFQMALRAAPSHLPTHEVMGRCWLEAGKPDMAARALKRALEAEFEVEDELIGIYYLMGRAQEDLGNRGEAMEFYDKVFSLDINFEDVTERLRALRED